MLVLTFLLVVQAIVAALLVVIILMQQSEGGGLGMGGSPTGLMSARGAADLMTRATTILAAVFIGLSILHAVLAARTTTGSTIDTSLARKGAPTQPLAAPNKDLLAIPTPGSPALPTPTSGTIPTPVPTSTRSQPSVRVERLKPTPEPRAEAKGNVSATAPVAPPPVVSSPVVPTPPPSNGN